MVLEWTSRDSYVFTELVFFIATCSVIFATIVTIFIVLLLAYRSDSSFFSLLRPLFENVFTSAIAFSQRKKESVKIVFLGNEQLDKGDFKGENKRKMARAWVHIYFTLLCCVAVLWFATIFSDAVLYRKTGTCLDLNVRDSDSRCFLLSTADVPPELESIINEEEGEAVPCQRVQTYLIENNSTYDLEVICYIARLSPLPALGIAYGTMKTLIFAIIAVLTAFLTISNKLKLRNKLCTIIVFVQVAQIVVSVVIIAIMVAVVTSIHVLDTRNTEYDFLRSERFYHSSVVALGGISIFITIGLFPWWAFKPLEPCGNGKSGNDNDGNTRNGNGAKNDGNARNGAGNAGNEARNDGNGGGGNGHDDELDKIHRMILLHQFSIRYRGN